MLNVAQAGHGPFQRIRQGGIRNMKKTILLAIVAVVIAALTLVFRPTAEQPPAIAQYDDVNAIYRPSPPVGAERIGDDVERFGNAVAMHNDMVLVGTSQVADFYLFNHKTGVLLQTFDATGGWSSDRNSLALNSRYALIGRSSARKGDGVAFLFDIETGELIQRIGNPNLSEDGRFGGSVALSETRALVGRFRERFSPSWQQEDPYLFLFDLDNLDNVLRLIVPDTLGVGMTGAEVALNDRYAVVKPIFNDTHTDGRTTVEQRSEVFVYDACSGALLHRLQSPWLSAPGRNAYKVLGDRNFGSALDLHDDHLLIGSGRYSEADVTSAYLYDLNDGSLQAEFSPTTANPKIQFGSDVALNETHAFFASGLDRVFGDASNPEIDGVLTIFSRETGEVVFEEMLSPAIDDDTSHLDPVVALSQTHFAFGTPMTIWPVGNEGAVYVKPLPGIKSPTVSGEPRQHDPDCQVTFDLVAESAERISELARDRNAVTAAEETERQEEYYRVRAAAETTARQIFAKIPDHDSETIRVIGAAFRFHTFDGEIVFAQIQSSDIHPLRKASILTSLEDGREGTVEHLQGFLSGLRNEIFCGSPVSELCYR